MGENIEHLAIRKFNIKEMAVNSKVAIIGKPATGKSTLIKDLLYQHRKKFTGGIIMSGTEDSTGFYNGLLPDLFIYGGYSQDAMNRLKLRQQKLVRKNGKNHDDNWAVLVNDDCMDNKEWIKHETTRWLFKNGRHFDIFFLLAMQFSLDIPPELRTCIDYVFILRQSILKDRRRVYENYAGIFPNFQMFCDVLDNLTEDYHCMVIKNRVTSSRIEDCVFWYKADEHDAPFKVGTPGLWKYHYTNYNERYEEEEEEEAMKRQMQKKYGNGKKNTTFVVDKLTY